MDFDINVKTVNCDIANHKMKKTSCREEEMGQISNWTNSLHQGKQHERHVYTAECFKYEIVQTSFTRSTPMHIANMAYIRLLQLHPWSGLEDICGVDFNGTTVCVG